ncbi:MAG: hypothetical protein LRY55_12370 [Leadbetterella sp.]|nr:hypothetical protein [Leadbetterella sp.]
MKTFFKKNLIAVFALLLGIGTMSFQMTERNLTTSQWYPVDEYGTITNSPLPEEPTGEDCKQGNPGPICAIEIELNPSNPFPSTVDDAYADHQVGSTTQRNE